MNPTPTLPSSQPSPAQVAVAVAAMAPKVAPVIQAPPPVTLFSLPGMIASEIPQPDRFILLAGTAFSGKTTAALSFPDPLVLDFDNKMPRAGVQSIPFYKDSFVETLVRRTNPAVSVNRRDALQIWLNQHNGRLSKYTIILDSLTALEVAFHQQTFEVEEKWGVNGGLYFGAKLNYFQSICALLAATGARVIINCHLTPVYMRDPNSGIDVSTGKHKAALAGSAAEKLPTFCTSVIYSYVKIDSIKGACTFWWVLRPCPAFDARTIATKIPASGEIEVTAPLSAYEQFRKCF